MDISKDELTTRFRQMTDDELVDRFKAGTLSQLGLEAASAELAARGIELPPSMSEAGEDAAANGLPELPPGVTLVTIQHFIDPLQASLARSQLESEGIFVHLWGEHLGIANIVFSAATGGMRLQVRNDQADRAREILAAIERGDYSLDENSEIDD